MKLTGSITLLTNDRTATVSYYEKRIKKDFLEAIELAIEEPLKKRLISRNKVRTGEISRTPHDSSCVCECDCEKVGTYLWCLKEVGLWPSWSAYRQKTLRAVLEIATEFRAVKCKISPSDSCKTCGMDFNKQVKDCIKKASSSFGGLCLDCVKYGKKDSEKDYSCRIEHEGYMGIEVCGIWIS